MTTTNKKDLIERIAEETNQTQTSVKRTVQTFLDHVIEELSRGHRVEFRGFGVFEIRERAPRTAMNPKTMETITIDARRTVKFKVGHIMKKALDEQPVACGDGGSTDGKLDGQLKGHTEKIPSVEVKLDGKYRQARQSL